MYIIVKSTVRVDLKLSWNYLIRLQFDPFTLRINPVTDHDSDKYEPTQNRL